MHKRSFTLIEVLVVVAVVMVLASMLLPALSKSREKVKSITCMANLKQMHLAFEVYIDDNDDWYPRFMDWRYKISPSLNNGTHWAGWRPLNTMPRSLICPTGLSHISGDSGATHQPNIFYRKWLLNSFSSKWPVHVLKSGSITEPTVAIVSYCEWKNNYVETWGSNPPLFPTTHKMGRNVHHADGHVETYSQYVDGIPTNFGGPLYAGWSTSDLGVDEPPPSP